MRRPSTYQTSWWYVLFPALGLLITTRAFNLLGDGIRDAMDPCTERLFAARRMRRRKQKMIRAPGGPSHDFPDAHSQPQPIVPPMP